MATDTDSKPVDELIVASSCEPAYSGERPSVPVNDYLESFNRIVTPVWVFDTDHSRVCWANQAALKMWRTESIEELAARDMGNEMSPTVAQRLEQYQQDFGNGASFTELWTLYPNGEPSTMRCIFSGIELDDGRMAMFCQGIEERPDTPDTLRSAQALLHTTVMISLYDLEGKTLYNNPAARAAQGDANAGLEQRFVDPLEFDALQHMLRRDAMASLVARIKTVHGPRWHEINARQSLDAVTGSPAVLISEVDVSDLKETERKAQYLAVHDTLTGLPNRTYMQNELLLHLEKARTDDLKLGLLFIDLDNFKTINDTLGHAVGDQLLIEVAERLRIHSNEGDIVTRLGGDEFVIVLHSVQNEAGVVAGVLAAVERLHQVLAAPIHIGEHALLITPSMGISMFPDDGEDIETLMKHADLAMYEAKDRGRNRHCFFSAEMKERAANRMELETDLRRAVDTGEFELFYQPQVSFDTGRITGGEALLRWRHAERGLLNPGDFITVAEETGLIEPIGQWVISNAAKQQRRWAEQGHNLRVSINLSPRQFRGDTLVSTIETIVEEDGCDPGMLDLEITESMLMGDNQRIIQALTQLHERGFKLAVDDFGTGYSNLAYLQRYPISCLKIDRSFVHDLHKTSAITQLIISMCKLLKVRIVAEGVEDIHQLEWLKLKGCHQYQGFYFSKPVPVDQFDQLLAREAAAQNGLQSAAS